MNVPIIRSYDAEWLFCRSKYLLFVILHQTCVFISTIANNTNGKTISTGIVVRISPYQIQIDNCVTNVFSGMHECDFKGISAHKGHLVP